MLRFAGVGLLAFPFLISCAKSQAPITEMGCTSPPEVEAAWRALDHVWSDCGYQLPCWQGKLAAARALCDRFPRELLAHRVLVEEIVWAPQELSEQTTLREQLTKEYGELSRLHPSNPAYPYLLGRLEQNLKSKQRLFEQAVARDPNFPWAHEALAKTLSAKPAEKDKARDHLEAFARICPGRTASLLGLLSYVEDRAAWEAHAPPLREKVRMENSGGAELLDLWELEFKFGEPAAYPTLRETVRRQLEIVRRADGIPDRTQLEVLAKGYELVGDNAGTRWVADSWLSQFPCSDEAFKKWLDRYQAEHGKYPEAEGPAEQKWLQGYLPAIETQLAQCSAGMVLWQHYFSALARREGTSPERLESAANRLLWIIGDRISGRVAKVFIEKRVRLDRVEALLDADRRGIEQEWRSREAMGLEGEDGKWIRPYFLSQIESNQTLRVRLALAQKSPAAAESALRDLAATIARVERSAATPEERQSLAYSHAGIWYWRAKVAELAGRNDDALVAFSRSLEKSPDDEETRKAAREMYVRIHGNADGFEAWQQTAQQVARTASEEFLEKVRRPLPDFKLTDVSGRLWTQADLRGKAVLVNFWATWCGPCIGEMPHIQKLHEKSRGRKDVAIVTVSVDDNPGLIEPFLKRSKYTFPALVGGAGSFQKWAGGSIPLSYVVDPNGTIVEELRGFGGDGDLWEKEMQERLEAAGASR